MDRNAFIAARRDDWQALEALLARVESHSFRGLVSEDAQRLGRLYRRAAADLLRARAIAPHDDLVDYLNHLVARAYGRIYTGRRLRAAAVGHFLARGFPAAVRRRRRAVGLAAALLCGGIATGFLAGALDSASGAFLLPPGLAGLRQLNPGQAFSPNEGAILSAVIMTNNIKVSFTAFALGLTFGLGTAWVLFSNGVLLGALAWRTVAMDQALHFWAFILPHGVIELACIALAGGAGLALGDALLRPGDRTRRDALGQAGRDALPIVAGVVPLLVLCGLIEGFVTPWDAIPDAAKVAFGLLTAVPLGWYLVRGAAPPSS